MPTRHRFATAALVVLLSTLGACDAENSASPVPIQPTTLPPGTWYMHAADDSTLPARIATRTVGVALEETFLDSARLVIAYNGLWSQRYWLRVNVSGLLDRTEVVLDEGIWGPPFSATYAFNSNVRTRTFSITVSDSTTIRTIEPMLFWTAAPTTSGVYRSTRP